MLPSMPKRTNLAAVGCCVSCWRARAEIDNALCRACDAARYESPTVFAKGVERRTRGERRKRILHVAVNRRELDRRDFMAVLATASAPEEPSG